MTAPAPEKDPAAVETAGLEIAIQRQQKAAPIPARTKITTTVGAVEKSAPIPAEALALRDRLLAEHERLLHALALRKGVHVLHDGDIEKLATLVLDAAILADRASQEERIREDERDRLYEAADRQHRKLSPRAFIGWQGGMFPFERARLRGDAS